jgi:rsbT co-antagonist protein RsbR
LRWLLIFVAGFALLQIIGAVVNPTVSTIASAVISGAHTILLVVAWVELVRKRAIIAVILISIGFGVVALFGSFGIPEALPVYILLPVLSAVVALPFLAQRTLHWMALIATIAAGVITSLAIFSQNIAASSFQRLALIIAVSGISGLTMFLLTQLHRRLNETLTETRAINAELELARSGLEKEVHTRTSALQTAMDTLAQRSTEQAALLEEIQLQREAIRELSMPVLPITPTTLVMPLIGALDTARLQEMQSQALRAIEQTRADTLLLDITGILVVDTQVAQGILTVVSATRLMGADSILVGIRPEVAQTIVGLGLDLSSVRTYADLQTALRHIRIG